MEYFSLIVYPIALFCPASRAQMAMRGAFRRLHKRQEQQWKEISTS
jgi:hypothetical protein